MIHFISPFRSDKNIGLALNDAIKQLNADPNDWICHLDQDAMWLLPDSKAQLETILNTTDYDILGPVTNRLALHYQLVTGMFDNYDIRDHTKMAKQIQDQYGNDIIPTTTILAAFCLCFRVSIWKKLGGFHQNTIQFDSLFSMEARKAGMKLGIMAGIYIFHAYRILSDNPRSDIKHLV